MKKKRTAMTQHTQPCKDCPWRRKSPRGWLGGKPVAFWLSIAHSDVVNNCHIHTKNQCAGVAIYRSNVCKSSVGEMLDLPADKDKVFAGPVEFNTHHHGPKKFQILPYGLIEAEGS